MDNPAQLKTQAFNMGVKWPGPQFPTNFKYLPLAKNFEVNGASEPTICEYLEPLPGGEYILITAQGEPQWFGPAPMEKSVLGSVDGKITWLPTEECD